MTNKPTGESIAKYPTADSERAGENGGLQTAGEVERLEQLLRERAKEVRSLRAARRWEGDLARELARRLGAASLSLGGGDGSRLLAELEATRGQAVELEAGRALLNFQVQELQGQLLEARGREDEELVLSEARLSGTSRGLRAALAETEEARDIAQARVLLLDEDLQLANKQVSTLEKQLQKHAVEAQERAELLHLQTPEVSAAKPDAEHAGDQYLRDDNALLRSLLSEVRRELVELSGAEAGRPVSQLDGRHALGPATAGTAVAVGAPVRSAGVADATAGVDQDTPSLRPPPDMGDSQVTGRGDVQVKALQRELASERAARNRERDVRSEERMLEQSKLTRLASECDEARAKLETWAAGKRVAIRQARVLLDHVSAGDPLAQEVGVLLEQLEA